MQFPEKLRILRKRHGITLRQLCKHIGVSISFISELESGRSHPNVKHVIKIADFFGVSVDVLVRDELNLDPDDEPS